MHPLSDYINLLLSHVLQTVNTYCHYHSENDQITVNFFVYKTAECTNNIVFMTITCAGNA